MERELKMSKIEEGNINDISEKHNLDGFVLKVKSSFFSTFLSYFERKFCSTPRSQRPFSSLHRIMSKMRW